MFKSKNRSVTISIPRKTLEAIFDECDRFRADETGGRIIGTYSKKGKEYQIAVLSIIGPGPNARRSPTSLFQDGEYQETVFREVEKEHPNLEHLGNWHTHHVNGLETLSSGDKATYHRIVNHDKHNTDFFYALLVVRKTPSQDQRYEIKHYFMFRNDDTVHEIADAQVHIQEDLGPRAIIAVRAASPHEEETGADANLERAKDQEFFSDFFPALKPAFSKGLGSLYWKGHFALIDGSRADVLAIETSDDGRVAYSITITGSEVPVGDVVEEYKQRSFKSARHAVLQLKREMDQEIYRKKKE